jgi:rhodanese-related sulfurtransferase
MKEVTVQELKKLIDTKADFQLVDVREEHEFDESNLNGLLIPLGDILDRASEISKDKQVVIHCRSGKRSATAIQALEAQMGYTNLYNLKGGILAYIEEIGL